MTMVEFLMARLDEDARVAEAATQHRWRAEPWTNSAGVEFTVIAREEAGPPAFAIKGERDAAHIARHDPARVLREVEAKRRIIDEHAPNEHGVCGVCVLYDDERRAPCPTLRLLALPYVGHEDYQDAWRPV